MASLSDASATARPRGEVVPQKRTGQALQFFTIAERVAALRASGTLQRAPGEAESGRPTVSEAAAVVAPVATGPSILGSAVLPMPAGELAAKWAEMAARWGEDQTILALCELGACASRSAALWLDLRRQAASLDKGDRLGFIHAAVNRATRYATDLSSRGEADHWASPLESIGKLGDCEDYAIAKYFLARSLGYSADELKIVVLFEEFSGMHHAVLAAWSGDDWVFLDNKQQALAKARDYRGSRPVAAVGETGQFLLVPELAQRISSLPQGR